MANDDFYSAMQVTIISYSYQPTWKFHFKNISDETSHSVNVDLHLLFDLSLIFPFEKFLILFLAKQKKLS